MATVQVQGIDIHVREQGQGPPVLFLHGNPDSGAVWDQVGTLMAPQFQCIAPDLPGFGESGPGKRFDPALANLAQFVHELILALDLTVPINLVVHDIGGPFGLAWAVRFPKEVGPIGILNTIFASDYRWHFWARIWRTPILGELSLLLLNRPLFVCILKNLAPQLSRDQINQMFDNFDPSMKRMILRFYRATDPETFQGWEDKLASLLQTKPALVLWGDQDPFIPPQFAAQLGAQTIKQFPDQGHWLMLEDPQMVATHLIELFSS